MRRNRLDFAVAAHLAGATLDRAGLRPAEAVGPVHVLDHSLRQHVASRRHGADDIGDGVGGGIALAPLEGRREAVVAELGMDGIARVLDPVERSGIARGDETRVVDLEASGHVIRERDARELGLRLDHGQQDDEPVVLLRLADISLAPVEGMKAPGEREAVLGGGLWRRRRSAHRNDGIERRVAAIGDDASDPGQAPPR